MFNKYNLKATFNLNSELLGRGGMLVRNGVQISHTKNKPEDAKYIYEGHEVAAHTLTHPYLPEIDDDTKAYLITSLFNIPATAETNLSNMVKNDLYGNVGRWQE